MYLCVGTAVKKHVCMCVYARAHVENVFVYVCVYGYSSEETRMYVCMCARTCVCVCARVCVCGARANTVSVTSRVATLEDMATKDVLLSKDVLLRVIFNDHTRAAGGGFDW